MENDMKYNDFIATSKIEDLKNAIVKLNRRAAKLNVSPFILTITSNTEVRKVTFHIDSYNNGERITKSKKREIEFTEIELSGEEIMIEGWNFIAHIDHKGEKNVINNFTDIDVNNMYADAAANCDHCGHNRRRNSTFIVRSVEGNTMQVGSTCLKDFTGHGDANKIVNIYGSLQTILGAFKEKDDTDYSSGYAFIHNTRKFVEHSVVYIQKHGFKSKAKCGYDEFPSSSFISDNTFAGYAKLDEDQKTIVEMILTTFVNDLKNKGTLNDFESNLLNLMSVEYFDAKYSSYVAAGVNSAMKNKEREAERATIAKGANEFIGKEGETVFAEMTVQAASAFSNRYSDRNVRYSLADEKGNVAVWFTAGKLKLKEGDTYNLRFKVKKHNVYKDNNQTIVNYVKVA